MLPQIALDRRAGVPLHHQLSDALRHLVLSGALPPGTRLPSTRKGAAELQVSRNVVVLAYEQLQLEGYLKAGVGSGTWVPEALDAHLLRPMAAGAAREVPTTSPVAHRLSRRGERLAGQKGTHAAGRPTHPFRPAAVAAELFPTRTWLRLSGRVWRSRTSELVHYGDVQGYRPLRERIAEHLARFRGVHCVAEQVLMTSGSQQSLDLIARMLIDPGDAAAIEDPGYHGAAATLAAAGARLLPIPVDDSGLDPGPAQEALSGARLLYTTPSHQYPLGVTLALERRLRILDWAARAGSWIIEDDYDSEFRFGARPLPALQGLDTAERVLYVGTFSKVLAPALRIGFVVLPPGLVDPFIRAREVVDHHPPIALQATLADFIAEGHLERHIARMRIIYAERRDALRDALRSSFGESCEIVPSAAGLHLTLLLDARLDDTRVSRLAADEGVDAEPLSVHYRGSPSRSGLVLGYGGFPSDQLVAAVRVLRKCVERAR